MRKIAVLTIVVILVALLASCTGGEKVDKTPPAISAVSASSITDTSTVITWTTDELATSQVEYGLTTSYGSTTTLDTTLVTSHSVSLSELSAGTPYHYRVKSNDASGNEAASGDYTFTTTPSNSTWQGQVTHAWVVAWGENWDADAEDDGIRVWIELLDKNEEMVEYSDTDMPIKIELYATESTTYPLEPSRLLYSGSGTATGWLHDAFITGAIGVKDISWEEISPTLPSEQHDYGILYITVTLPSGKEFSARYDEAEIRER
jgi:hypothetical protein